MRLNRMALRMALPGDSAGGMARHTAAMNALVLALLLSLPPDLAATGYDEVEKTAFAPQYPLWTDGASKRRWIHLPPGAAIDATRPDDWVFPVGTKLWKEFSLGGRRIETRYIERLADGRWRFTAYAWNAAGTEATRAPA